MSDLIRLTQILNSGDIPAFYEHAPKGTKCPFLTFTVESSNFAADNRVYSKGLSFRAVLYTVEKNLDLEEAIETILDNAEIVWERDEVYLDDELLYQEIYTGTF